MKNGCRKSDKLLFVAGVTHSSYATLSILPESPTGVVRNPRNCLRGNIIGEGEALGQLEASKKERAPHFVLSVEVSCVLGPEIPTVPLRPFVLELCHWGQELLKGTFNRKDWPKHRRDNKPPAFRLIEVLMRGQ